MIGVILAICLGIAAIQLQQNNSYEQTVAAAESLGEVLGVTECSDEDGRFYIVDSSAFGGCRLTVADGKVLSVSKGENGITVMKEQTDFYGNKVNLPIEYYETVEGATYLLSDFTKNAYSYYYTEQSGAANIMPYMSADGIFTDAMAVSVYDIIMRAYDFYADEANIGVSWKGINGGNDDIAYNASENNEVELLIYNHFGNQYENANCGYDPESGYAIMYVGDGRKDGVIYNQGKAVDVIAHEYQHAITQFASIGGNGIEYLNDAGAISEAVSDIFGALIEGHELSDDRFWMVGEEAVPGNEPGLRSIASPMAGYVYHISDKMPLCHELHDHNMAYCDSGNTHGNCTILTHAQYRMWQCDPEFFTRENIGKLWFATLRNLGYRPDFDDFTEAMLKATDDLNFPASAKATVRNCLFERGLIEGENVHTLTFIDENGFLVDKISVEHGGDAIAPVLPDEMDGDMLNAFMGWDGDTTNVTEDRSLRAVYKLTSPTHSVTFKCDDKVISQVEVEHRGEATAPSEPFKASDETYKYVFTGWDAEFDNVLDDIEVNAVFDKIYITYHLTFFDGETLIDQRQGHYGETIDSLATPPSKTGYDFVGWKDGDNVVDKVTIGGNAALFAVWRLSAWVYCLIAVGGAAVIACVVVIALILVKKRKRQ